MAGLAAKAAVTVLRTRFGLGKKNPPALEAELSNGSTLVIRIDDVLDLTGFRLYASSADVIGKDVFRWWTGLSTETVDALLAEVRASNAQWWAENWS